MAQHYQYEHNPGSSRRNREEIHWNCVRHVVFKKVCHLCDGDLGRWEGIRLEIVRSDISIPSLRSSPWILGAPQSGLACAILRIGSQISVLIGGRPGPLERDLNLQNSLKPFLCHFTTVSGLTMIKVFRQSFQKRESKIQNKRSRLRNLGRLIERFIVASCWRNARFSKARSGYFLNPKSMFKSSFIIDDELTGTG